MARYTRDVPDQVYRAAAEAWKKWSARIAAVPPPAPVTEEWVNGKAIDPLAGKSPRERMIEKIKRRMHEYPEWYETDSAKVAAAVCAELERIGLILDRALADTDEPVEVWQVPLSVFNWLIVSDEGEDFVRGALSAWSCAQGFNEANGHGHDAAERARLRTPFYSIAPPLLKAVLEQMLQDDLWITFGQKFVGSDLAYLVMRVQRPPRQTPG